MKFEIQVNILRAHIIDEAEIKLKLGTLQQICWDQKFSVFKQKNINFDLYKGKNYKYKFLAK